LKLPIPKFSLPFLKKRGVPLGDDGSDAADDDGFDADPAADADAELAADDAGADSADPERIPDDDAASDEPGRLARIGRRLKAIAGPALLILLALIVLGGTGGLFGWLLANADSTTAKRNDMRPQLTVDILEEGEEPTPNSTSSAPEHRTNPEEPADGKTEPQQQTANVPEPPPNRADDEQLNPVVPDLYEERDGLRLPIIALDGREIWTTYARPFEQDDPRPRLALLVTNLGMDTRLTDMAIDTLPGAVTLSFSPYARDLSAQITRARSDGHEVMIDLPMEPLDFPRDDPGPQTLLTSLATVENLNRLEWVLGQAQGYVGVATWLGSQFTTVEDALMPVLEGLKERGVLFLDSRDSSRSLAAELASSIQLPRVYNDRFIDAVPARGAIDRTMQDLERQARQQDYAVGLARPLPLTIERLAAWVPVLQDRGISIAPVSALANRQRIR